MSTPNIPGIQLGDLLAYLEGTAPSALSDHISAALTDPALQAELLALQISDLQLTAALYRLNCPSSDDLYAYHTNSLNPNQRSPLQQHTQHCSHCQAELDWLTAAQAEVAVESSSRSAWAAKAQKTLETVKRTVVNALQMPHTPQLSPALRGQQKTQSIYQAEDYRLVIVLTPPLAYEQIWQVEGQVSHLADDSPLAAPATLSLWQDEAMLLQDELDDFGYFSLNRVEAGTYTLALDLATTRILIEDFHVS